MQDLKVITITEPESLYVERCFYEWDGIQKILSYITKQGALTEHLEYYTKLALEKNYELEKAKAEVLKTYLPNEKDISYEFDFDNNALKYWGD